MKRLTSIASENKEPGIIIIALYKALKTHSLLHHFQEFIFAFAGYAEDALAYQNYYRGLHGSNMLKLNSSVSI